jgi:hypothetical protein
MEVITEYGNYWDLKDHSWSGALDTLKDIEKADKEDELMQHLEEVFMDETPTDTEINDYLWFERGSIYEAVGLNENGEIPTVFDELDDDYTLDEDDIANMEDSGLFHPDFIKECKEDIEKSWNETDPHKPKGYIVRSKDWFDTEEQAEWIRDNL